MFTGIWQLALAIVVLGTLIFGIPACVLLPSWRRRRNEQRLQATGEPAMARILALRETGNLINYRQEMRIDVEVMHPTRGTWNASLWRVMGVQDIQFFVPGRVFEVRFDPAEPDVVAPAP